MTPGSSEARVPRRLSLASVPTRAPVEKAVAISYTWARFLSQIRRVRRVSTLHLSSISPNTANPHMMLIYFGIA